MFSKEVHDLKNEQKRLEFRKHLRQLLTQYQGKKINSIQHRILQGVKTSNFVNLEKRKMFLKEKKKFKQKTVQELQKQPSLARGKTSEEKNL